MLSGCVVSAVFVAPAFALPLATDTNPHNNKQVAAKMLGDLDLMQCAGRDAPTMRRLSVELGHNNTHNNNSSNGVTNPTNAKDIPSLRRLSCSSVSSTRSSMSQDGMSGALSPSHALSSSVPNAFFVDRVTSLLGRASSLPTAQNGLPSIPTSVAHPAAAIPAGLPASPSRLGPSLMMANSAPTGADSSMASSRASALIRSLSKGMDSFR